LFLSNAVTLQSLGAGSLAKVYISAVGVSIEAALIMALVQLRQDLTWKSLTTLPSRKTDPNDNFGHFLTAYSDKERKM
jgi:hypothetical protein